MTAKKRKEAVIIPADLFFYPIPLTQPNQFLTRDELNKHFAAPKARKAYMGNSEELLSFENSILTVKVNLNDNSEHRIYLHTEKEELNVACSCGMQDGKLCYHAFMGLHGLCWQSEGFNCQKLYWPGYYDNLKTRKFLNVEISKANIYVTFKAIYGQVFRSQIGYARNPSPILKEQTDKYLNLQPGDTVVYSYALCFAACSFRDRHYPLLIPFYGTTSKNGLKVASYSKFILPGKEPKPNEGYPCCKSLNQLSKTMYEIIKPLTSKRETRDMHIWLKTKHSIFELWQKALPLLINYPYNQSYHLYWLGYLKDRPMKRFMSDCRYSMERPSLVFLLTFYKDYFQLSVEVVAGSKVITVNHKPHLFIFDEQANNCYLMGSIQDDDLLIWMMDNKNKITVLKEHFDEFNNCFLADLNEHYTVFFSDRSGIRMGYNYNLVKTITGI